jgi:hypothetical protein
METEIPCAQHRWGLTETTEKGKENLKITEMCGGLPQDPANMSQPPVRSHR